MQKKPQPLAVKSKKPQIIGLVVGVLIALYLLGWGVQRLMANRQLAKVKDIGENIFEQTKNLPEEEHRAKWEEYRAEMDRLKPEQRQQIESERFGRFQKREKEKMDKFFQAQPKEQLEMLDNDIKREEEFRKRMEQMMQNGGGWGGFGGGAGGGGRGPGGPGGGGGGGGGDRRSRSNPEERENMRKRMLDNSTPEFRAQMAEYRSQMKKRREALGLPPSPWGGGGGMPKGGAPKGGAPKSGV